MAYLASVHKASSVRFALKANFLFPDEPALIVAKSNRVEAYSFSGDGLSLRTSFTVYGRITGLLTTQPANSPTAHLLIATEAQDYLTVSWDEERHTIRNERAAKDVADKFLRDAECGPLYRADPQGRMLGFHVYEGSFLAIPIVAPPRSNKTGKIIRGSKSQKEKQIGDLDEPDVIRMKQIKVADLVFLHGVEKPTIAILHRDGTTDSTTLVSYKVPSASMGEDLEPWTLEAKNLEAEAKFLIPVSEPMGGVLVVGEQAVTYVSPEDDPIKRPFPESLISTAWGAVDNQRFLLGDELGRLKVIFLEVKDERVTDIKVESIGETAVASAIVYLDNGHVFIGSHFGDSQLVKLAPTDPKCQVIQAFPNLAPILDFRVLDGASGQGESQEQQQSLYSSGQSRIVTGSGGYRDGGLRSMKSGVGLEDAATVLEDMEGVRSIWALQSNPEYPFDDTLVLSLIDETRVIQFDPEGDVEELETFKSFKLQEETLAACNLPNGRILQVTGSCATLVDIEGGTVLAEATPGASISTASVTEQYLVCAVGGREIICYDLTKDMLEIGRAPFEHEIACLNASSGIVAVGFWTTQTISLLSLPDLVVRSQETLGDSIPRSVLIANLLEKRPPTLLVAMGDGTMYTFTVDVSTFGLSEKKVVVLGTQAFYFYPVPRENGVVSVFAACDHPSLIYGEDGRIAYSAVTADNIIQLHSFNAEAFPRSVAILAGTELKISTIDPARAIHVKTLSIGDVIRRVCYSKETQLFGVVTVHSAIDSLGAESFTCYVRIIDDATFTEVDSYALGDNELVESLACIKLDNGAGDGSTNERLLVGTGILSEDSDEAIGGRILVFEISHQRKLKYVTELKTKSGVKSIDAIGSKIVTAMNKTVDVLSYTYPPSASSASAPSLKQLVSYRAHTEPIDMGVSNNIITVGDIMKGPYLLQLSSDPEGNVTLKEVARSFQPSWTTAVELLDDDTVVAADNEGNLQIWERNKSGIAEDQRRLQVIGEGKLWEMANRIRRINTPFVSTDATPITPKAHIATVDGSIYLLSIISPAHINLFLQLQTNLARVIKGIGDLQFMKFRAFSDRTRAADEPYRFVDGDFVERFLELRREEQEFVTAGAGEEGDKLDMGVDELRSLLEGLRRMH